MKERKNVGLGGFEKYLTLWVAACIVIGVAIGQVFPGFPATLSRFEYSQVSIPVALLIWLMIYPMMVQIDFSSIVAAGRQRRAIGLASIVNWLIKPFTMFAISWFFLRIVFAPWIPEELASQYIAGAILLGAAPCTAMVFVWSYLTKGDPAYTLVQVAIDDLVLLFLYAPIVMLLLGLGDIFVPYDTILLSVVLYVLIPLLAGYFSRGYLLRTRGRTWFNQVFLKRLSGLTTVGLLLTLVILFSFQGEVILGNPLHIVLIAVPLIVQTFFVFSLSYNAARALKIQHSVAGPAALISSSNFFELAVAAAISLFGLASGAALATVVGVLVEVPIMLMLVRIVNRTKGWFPLAHGSKC